jgi:hypothetical protein
MGVEICKERLVWVLIILIALPPTEFTLGGIYLMAEVFQSLEERTSGFAEDIILIRLNEL